LHWAYLRLGWEMDGTWFNWNAAPGSGREASYAGCFRRIVQVMRQAQPANQWKFVLNPTVGWYSKSYLDAIWPGDAYVDVVALDLYDQSWKPNARPGAS
jgi:beta-mannanase